MEDKVFITSNFAEYLRQRIKVDGKTGKLGDQIKIADDGAKVSVNSSVPFSKRYLKYLTKKYLKKHSLREFLYVIAKDKKTYEVKYFNIQQDEAAEEWVLWSLKYLNIIIHILYINFFCLTTNIV